MKHLIHLKLIFLAALLPMLVFGQKKYKFKYREYLISRPSTFTTQSTDVVSATNTCTLSFFTADQKGEPIPFADIKIKGSKADTIIYSDIAGMVSVTLLPGIFSVSVSAVLFTGLQVDNLVTKANTNTTIETSLGQANNLRIALIYSKRKLTDTEIEKILEDLSDNKEDNELIKNKTCYVVWEI